MLYAPALAAAGDTNLSFKDKTITIVVPTAVGGGTDLSARVVTKFFPKYLPGEPTVIVLNVPGGNGVTALNFMVQQAKPDGLTLSMTASIQADRSVHRAPQAHYDPTAFQIVGGIGIPTNVLVIRSDALPRLLDRSKPPVIMGAAAGAPRFGMWMPIWGAEVLGWNTKWVIGYRGTNDLVLALERGELDMTALITVDLTKALMENETFTVLYRGNQTPDALPTGKGIVDNAPLFTTAVEGKIKDPKIQAAYDYWREAFSFKWLALPPGTPDAVRDVYRDAFLKTTADPEFTAQAELVMKGFTIMSPEDTVRDIRTLAEVSDDTLDVMDMLLRKHGLNIPTNEKK